MFIFNLTFIKPLSVVERAMDAHNAYLDQHYADGTFICSGGKVPRTGGIILCTCNSKQEAMDIMKQDPFYKEDIARYELLEFAPTKAAEAFRACLL